MSPSSAPPWTRAVRATGSTETALIDGGLLDSFAILELVSALEDAYGVEITATELVPKNFNSAQAMWDMIQRLQKN